MVYVIVFAVFILILFGAYRSLGMPAATVTQPERLLAGLRDRLAASVSTLAADRAAAADARRQAAAAAQQLSQIDSDQDAILAARDLLSAAAESLGWAARLAEANGDAANPGMVAAVAPLLAHASRCLEAAVVEDGVGGCA